LLRVAKRALELNPADLVAVATYTVTSGATTETGTTAAKRSAGERKPKSS
jgi:hypothetical protein